MTELIGDYDTALEVMVAAQVVKMAEALGNDEEFTAVNAMIAMESRVALDEPEVLRFKAVVLKAVSRRKAVMLKAVVFKAVSKRKAVMLKTGPKTVGRRIWRDSGADTT